jgi:L-lactate utilization protein LutB
MDSIKQKWIEARLKKAADRLEAHGFKADIFGTKQEAREAVLNRLRPGTRVAIGGSVTIRDLDILETLKERGNILLDHWAPGLSRDDSLRIRRSQMTADVFLGSSNAVTMNGELVNVDGAGNRVNSMTFGPGVVLLVCGFNKVVEDVQEGMKRIRDVAAPMNARRLNLDLPCAKLGKCVDCNASSRICRVLVVLERQPLSTEIHVILVGEELGY